VTQETKRITPVIGTNRLKRPFTKEEREYFAHLLEQHDFRGATLIALAFAVKLTRSIQRAREIMSRVDLRLVEQGWDPNEVPLARALCRFVWSEASNARREARNEKKAVEGWLREMETEDALHTPSVEEHRERLAAEQEEEERAKQRVEALRASFREAKDDVNLIWLELSLGGEDDLQKMAERTGRDVKEFYRATDRRKRHVKRVLESKDGAVSEEDA
jgi:hypothetical protein